MKAPGVSGAFTFGLKEIWSVQDRFEKFQLNARKHLRSLVIGVDPYNHERFSPESGVVQPEIRRSLELALDLMDRTYQGGAARLSYFSKRSRAATRSSASEKTSTAKPKEGRSVTARAGMSWSTEEDAQIRREFLQKLSVGAVAARHQRTRGAITARLVHLGLVASREEARKLSRGGFTASDGAKYKR